MSNKRCMTPKYIPEEILIGILVRLPVKSLVRFMCVSKSWSRLISSSSFVSTHLKSVRKHGPIYLIAFHQYSRDKRKIGHSLFCNGSSEQCLELRLPFENSGHFGVYGSSNGLLCISKRVLLWRSQFYIWNPSIRKLRILPMVGIPQQPCAKYDIGLSFGFHPDLNDYKVVRMLHFGHWEKDTLQVHVYTLSTNSWKEIKVIPHWLQSTWKYWGCEFWSGVVYWLIEKDSNFRIVSFATGSENFGEVMVPTAISTRGLLCIKVYKESICLLELVGMVRGKKCANLWVMQEQSFKKLGTFSFHGEGSLPMGFSPDNELLVEDGDYRDGIADLVLYNFESKRVNAYGAGIRLVLSRYGCLLYGSLYNCYASYYVESLALLKG